MHNRFAPGFLPKVGQDRFGSEDENGFMRLLVIEDEPDLAQALARGLRHHGYAVDVVYDGAQGWELAITNEYDLLILDLNLPGMDGLEVCRRVRASRPALLILVLTARSKPDERVAGLDLGADDYLVKPFHFAELAARIRALLRRDMRVRSPLLQYKDLKLDPTARVAWLGNRRLELTGKEFSILEYLMRHQGEVVSQEALLEHVWDMQVNPLTNTVRVHINSLRRKLEDMAETPRYIETSIGLGYALGIAKNLEESP
jgi:DNA-binding response OmpR family regulator